ncbi:hypothetical protein [Paraburkholderia graminis]
MLNVACTCKPSASRYTPPVVGKQPANRFGDLQLTKAQRSRAENVAFVFVSACVRLQWVGMGGETFGSAGFLGLRFANPAHCPLTPFGVGARVHKPDQGGRTVRHIHARAEQQQSSILEIIRAALRDAATAPTVFDALYLTGDALHRLAEIARAEVRHE